MFETSKSQDPNCPRSRSRHVMLRSRPITPTTSVSSTHTALIHRATPDIAWKCLNTILTSQFHYLDILFPGIAKNAFPGLTIFKIFWSLLAGVLHLIAVNMHYCMPNLHFGTPKLQILAITLPSVYIWCVCEENKMEIFQKLIRLSHDCHCNQTHMKMPIQYSTVQYSSLPYGFIQVYYAGRK